MTKKEWKGANFLDFCSADRDDTRKINYTFHIHRRDGWHKKVFTSEDDVDTCTLMLLRSSEIREVKMIGGEWFADLEYYSLV